MKFKCNFILIVTFALFLFLHSYCVPKEGFGDYNVDTLATPLNRQSTNTNFDTTVDSDRKEVLLYKQLIQDLNIPERSVSIQAQQGFSQLLSYQSNVSIDGKKRIKITKKDLEEKLAPFVREWFYESQRKVLWIHDGENQYSAPGFGDELIKAQWITGLATRIPLENFTVIADRAHIFNASRMTVFDISSTEVKEFLRSRRENNSEKFDLAIYNGTLPTKSYYVKNEVGYEAITLHEKDLCLYAVSIFGITFDFSGAFIFEEGENAYDLRTEYLEMFGIDDHYPVPEVYIDRSSDEYVVALEWLKNEGLIDDDNTSVRKPFIYFGPFGGADQEKGFSDMMPLAELIYKLHQETEMDIIINVNWQAQETQIIELKQLLSNPERYGNDMLDSIHFIDAITKTEEKREITPNEYLKYLIALSAGVVCVEGGNVHAGISYGTKVFSIISERTMNAYEFQIESYEPSGNVKYRHYVLPEQSDDSWRLNQDYDLISHTTIQDIVKAVKDFLTPSSEIDVLQIGRSA